MLFICLQCLLLSTQVEALDGLQPGEVGINHQSCGIASIDFRIVNGLVADIERFPWLVFLRVRYRSVVTRCAGSIITSRHILTAGHCTIWTNNQKATSIVMMYGASEFSAGTKVIVKHFYRHENFDFQTFKNDLAILWLDEPIKLGPKARTICLPKSPQNLVGKTVVSAARYLNTTTPNVSFADGTGSPVLRYTTQVVWNLEQCIQGLGGIAFYSPQQICAYKRGSDACQKYVTASRGARSGQPHFPTASAVNATCAPRCRGDSGAPLMLKNGDVYEIVGLVSFGDGCNIEGVPGVYTNIEMYTTWIRDAIESPDKYENTYA
ncbi:hypothetical protein MRX96_004237 [Rhipicephalus microplus]